MEAGELEHASLKEERGRIPSVSYALRTKEYGQQELNLDQLNSTAATCTSSSGVDVLMIITWSLAFTELLPMSPLELTTVRHQPSPEGQLINVPGSLRTGPPGCLLFKAWTLDVHEWIRLSLEW